MRSKSTVTRRVYKPLQQPSPIALQSSLTELGFMALEFAPIKKLDVRLRNEGGKVNAYFSTGNEFARGAGISILLIGTNPKIDVASSNPEAHGFLTKVAYFKNEDGHRLFFGEINFGHVKELAQQLGSSAVVDVTLFADG